jgi:hypothetical protein
MIRCCSAQQIDFLKVVVWVIGNRVCAVRINFYWCSQRNCEKRLNFVMPVRKEQLCSHWADFYEIS